MKDTDHLHHISVNAIEDQVIAKTDNESTAQIRQASMLQLVKRPTLRMILQLTKCLIDGILEAQRGIEAVASDK